jgi:hypothetical protein
MRESNKGKKEVRLVLYKLYWQIDILGEQGLDNLIIEVGKVG